jgi:hypothetical protein
VAGAGAVVGAAEAAVDFCKHWYGEVLSAVCPVVVDGLRAVGAVEVSVAVAVVLVAVVVSGAALAAAEVSAEAALVEVGDHV